MDILDLKGLYRGTPVDVETDPELYRAVAEAFPSAYLEDPDLNDETRPVLEPHADRITWDAPLHSLADIEALERKPRTINSKPSRFGSLGELFAVYEHCEREGIAIYGGGQGELGPGRGQIQYLASLFHPDTPNDVAPSGYNDPAVPDGLPSSPLDPAPFGDRLSLGRVGGSLGRRRPRGAADSLRRETRPGGPMPQKPFADALNEQIANEFAAHQQYIGAAVYYESETLPRLAAFFYRQAVEERNHAMMMVQYLLDANQEVRIPDIEAKLTRFNDVVAPVRMALEQEQVVTEEINALFKLARDNGDYQAEQFMQWFVKEQVEEVSTMTDLLTVVERSADNALLVEEYLAREKLGEGQADPTAPPAAGGAL